MTNRSGARPGLTLGTVALVQFMVSLDLSVVNVGLPQIAAGLGFSAVGLTWVIHAYALTFGGLLLLGGKAADRYGRRRILLLGLGLFGLASLAGGFARDPGHLVAARAVQGMGAAALAPAALALLTTTFPTAGPASGPSGYGVRRTPPEAPSASCWAACSPSTPTGDGSCS
ncbi:Putative multidrug resistance protein MdtD [Streptomyces violarus]